MEQLQAWINTIDFLNPTIQRYIVAAVILFISMVFKRLLSGLITRFFLPLVNRTNNSFDDLLLCSVRRPLDMLVMIAGLFIALQVLQLPIKPTNYQQFGNALIKTLLIFNLAWILFNTVAILERTITGWAKHTGSALDENLLPFIRKITRGFIVVIAIVLVIQNLGYSISGLLASLGIGGLAVALAAKDTLSNVFGSVMILLDRPFKVGDWIKTGDIEGTVEDIGFRSTRVRTFAKTMITVPNNIIATSSLNNFSRMPKRRIKMTIGVTYDSTAQQMRTLVGRIRTMLEHHSAIDQQFMLVNFTEFGPSSLDILVYCFTINTNWEAYLKAREDVCLKIMDIIDEADMEMAFPSQTVYLHNQDDAQLHHSHQIDNDGEGRQP